MRGYGVPEGLATLAHAAKRGKTRRAPYSPSHRAASSRRPARAARSFGGSVGCRVWPVTFAPGQPCSRWSSASPGQAGPVGVFAPATRLSRAPQGEEPRALYLAEPLKRFSDRLLRVAGQFAYPRPKPIAMENGVAVVGPLIPKPEAGWSLRFGRAGCDERPQPRRSSHPCSGPGKTIQLEDSLI